MDTPFIEIIATAPVGGGEITFEWLIDGEATTFDVTGRAWLQPILDWLNENFGLDSTPRIS